MNTNEIKSAIKEKQLTIIDDFLLKQIENTYWAWKDLNTYMEILNCRKVNFPSAISESIICYELDLYWSNAKLPGDAYTKEGEMVEIKASSNYNDDTTSFSPDHNFDYLYFGRLNYEEDTLYIYNLELNSQTIKNIKVNKNETFGDQQQQKRRPRFGIIDKLIIPNNLEPIAKHKFVRDQEE